MKPLGAGTLLKKESSPFEERSYAHIFGGKKAIHMTGHCTVNGGTALLGTFSYGR